MRWGRGVVGDWVRGWGGGYWASDHDLFPIVPVVA